MDHFIRDADTYHRHTQLVPDYVHDAATYLSLMSGKPYERAVEYVKKTIGPGGKHALVDPMTNALVRGANGDRELRPMPLSQYLRLSYDNNEVLAPNLTSYMSADKKEGIPGQYIRGNLAKRSGAKKSMLAARQAGDRVAESIHNAMQTTYKYSNNALSGGHRSVHTPLYLKSAHSTLTSFCRCATSYGNANNEKFLLGNRHYWCADVVKTNIISIINHSDLSKVATTMAKYGLHYPTAEETMACIRRSTDLYWRDDKQMGYVERLVSSLSDVQRAVFVYTSDLYHLAQYNDSFVREIFDRFIAHPVEPEPDADTWIKAMNEDTRTFVSLLCSRELNGGDIKTLKEGGKWADDLPDIGGTPRPADPHAYGILAATGRGIYSTLEYYADLIATFWVTDNMPASISFFPSSLRRTAITSDTDSTIFTVQHWVRWYTKSEALSQRGKDVGYTAVYLTSQVIRHVLAKLSANLGVRKKDLFELEMKNEYFFDAFVLTSNAKHYFALISAREGNVYRELEMEVKGVGLRNSKVPAYFNKEAKRMMNEIMETVLAGKKINLKEILADVASKEKMIMDNVLSGNYDHLTKEQIRSAEAYKNPMSSNYIHYEMWEEVFAPKYGRIEPPPYRAVKVALNLSSKTMIQEWLDRIEDAGIKTRMAAWLERMKKNDLTMLLMPESILAEKGVPPEVVCGVDVRKLIMGTLNAYYLVLESLCVFVKNPKNTRLIMDAIDPKLLQHVA